jgi:hypothetical protein
MNANAVELIGFDSDEALDDISRRFGLLADYKSFLPEHLTELLKEQNSSVEIRSLELLGTPNCDTGGMPSPDNEDHVIVNTIKIPLDLRIHLSTTGQDLHELDVTLVINAEGVNSTPQLTSDMLIQNHRELPQPQRRLPSVSSRLKSAPTSRITKA